MSNKTSLEKIAGCKNLDYWERLKYLRLLSLQRRRERYCIIQVWKMMNGLAPNEIGMVFYEHKRLGMKVTLPTVNNKARISVKTDYENSFRITASRLWLWQCPGRLPEQDTWYAASPWVHSGEQKLAARLEQWKTWTHLMLLAWSELLSNYSNVMCMSRRDEYCYSTLPV